MLYGVMFVRDCILHYVLDDVETIFTKVQWPRVFVMLLLIATTFVITIVFASENQITCGMIIFETVVVIAIKIAFSCYVALNALKSPYISCLVDYNIRKAKDCGNFTKFKEKIGLGKDSLALVAAINALTMALIRGLISFILNNMMSGARINSEQIILGAVNSLVIADFLALLGLFVFPNIIMYSLYNSRLTAHNNGKIDLTENYDVRSVRSVCLEKCGAGEVVQYYVKIFKC